MIPVEKIFEAIVAQAKQGSCKTCKWCTFFMADGKPEPTTLITRECEMQGNVNPIWFTDADLNSKPYPWVCDVGDFRVEEGCLLLCLAYQPADGEVAALGEDESYLKALVAHRDFMYDLAEAVHLTLAVQDNTLAKLTAKLNEATDSLPKPSTGGNSRLQDFIASLERGDKGGEPE